jgi:hypothetical protein
MTAAMLVLGPIFKADLPSELYDHRPGRNAQQAVVEVEELLFRDHPEVVDADLVDYLDTASYCPLAHEVRSKSSGCRFVTIDRLPGREVLGEPDNKMSPVSSIVSLLLARVTSCCSSRRDAGSSRRDAAVFIERSETLSKTPVSRMLASAAPNAGRNAAR